MLPVGWRDIFVPTVSLPEVIVRGTLVYLLLFLALRFFLKRNAGQIGVADLLVIVLVSEVCQGALVGEAKSIVESGLSVAVILFWTFTLNWLSFRFPALAQLTASKPLRLVEDGRLNRRNMQRELITYEELASQMRQHGIETVEGVKSACLEGDGTFSFIRMDDGEMDAPKPKTVA